MAGYLEVCEDAKAHLESSPDSPAFAPRVQTVPIVRAVAHHRNGMVGTAVAAMGVDATTIGHETRICIEVGRDGSTLQQSLPCQVVNLLGVGMVVTGDGDVFASGQGEFVLPERSSEPTVATLRGTWWRTATDGEMFRALAMAEVGVTAQITSGGHSSSSHQVKDPI